MLSPSEFTVGKVGNVKPLCLILPTNKYEETMLVGQFNEAAAAVFLSGKHRSHFFESLGNESWGGLIIPNVRIEVDETSCVDAYHAGEPPLFVVRTDTRLVLVAKRGNPIAGSTQIALHDNLVSTGESEAAFSRWQVVLGKDENKRVIWSSTGTD